MSLEQGSQLTHFWKLDGLMRRLVGMCVLWAVVAPAVARAQTPQAPPQRQQAAGAATVDEELRPGTDNGRGRHRHLVRADGRGAAPQAVVGELLPHQHRRRPGIHRHLDVPGDLRRRPREPRGDLRQLGARHPHRPRHPAALLRQHVRRSEHRHRRRHRRRLPAGPRAVDRQQARRPLDWRQGESVLHSRPQARRHCRSRCNVKLPVGDEESGASSGKTDFVLDGIVSGRAKSRRARRLRRLHLARQSGRLRADQRLPLGRRRRASHRNQPRGCGSRPSSSARATSTRRITAPAGLFGSDGSAVPRADDRAQSGGPRARADLAGAERVLHRRRRQLEPQHGRPQRSDARLPAGVPLHRQFPDLGGDKTDSSSASASIRAFIARADARAAGACRRHQRPRRHRRRPGARQPAADGARRRATRARSKSAERPPSRPTRRIRTATR